MTRHDAYEPACKHTVYQRCLSTRAILCGNNKRSPRFKLADVAKYFKRLSLLEIRVNRAE